ncbi:MAG: hypothetical protein HY326_05935 [Chloroflexi bacterium]|nr:hypothetical protein [Chloroflexota bacterium]
MSLPPIYNQITRQPWLLLAPAIFILGFTEIFSLAVAELLKPFYNLTTDMGGFWSSLILSLLFLVTAAFQLRSLKISRATAE